MRLLLFYLATARPQQYLFFFFNDTATTEIYTLSLHDALPISLSSSFLQTFSTFPDSSRRHPPHRSQRSEEHTSELQSQSNLVCRLLLEKKKRSDDRTGYSTLPCKLRSRKQRT